MKIWLSAFFMVMLLASSAIAETYIVKKGDTLSGIAKRQEVTIGAIQSANPQIRNINQIQLGWKLQIPEKTFRKGIDSSYKVAEKVSQKFVFNPTVKNVGEGWIKPGANKFWVGAPQGKKFFAKMSLGLSLLDYNQNIQEGLLEQVKLGKFKSADIQHVSNGGLVKDSEGNRYLMVKMLGGELRPGVFELITGEEGVIPSWDDPEYVYTARLYEFQGHFLLIADVCDNPAVVILLDKPPVVVTTPEVPVMQPPIDMIIPPIAKTPKQVKPGDKWDWYVGAGNYHSRIQGNDNHGKYDWTKFRYRPVWFEPEKNSLGVKRVGLGAFGFLAGGDGIAAKYYDYDWREAVVGLTAKIEAERSDYDLDIGWGKLWNKGAWMGKEDRDQIDEIFLFSAHGNFYSEDQESNWFRKSELNGEYRLPVHTRMKKGTKSDNRIIEATFTQWIYAAEIGEDNSLVVSPGLNLGAGYEWGADDEDFIKVGPAFEFTSYGNVIGGVSVYNYKFQDKGQWQPIGGYVSIDGISNAWKASHITGVSAEDLEGLQGQDSKLLANPADFL